MLKWQVKLLSSTNSWDKHFYENQVPTPGIEPGPPA